MQSSIHIYTYRTSYNIKLISILKTINNQLLKTNKKIHEHKVLKSWMYLTENIKIYIGCSTIQKISIPLYMIHFIKTVLQVYKPILHVSC